MAHDHEGQRVSRRRLLAGVSSVGFGALVTACAGRGDAVTTSTGETVALQAVTDADLTALFAGARTCTLTASTTQGPYYFDADKIRSDVREDKQGVKLRLALQVQDSETCRPIPHAVVEIWHCDAGGLYSGAEAASGGGGTPPTGPPPTGTPPTGGPPPSGDQDLEPTDDKRYLRGAQVTNQRGVVEFTTIWPGWYRGRTVHVHVMVHVGNEKTLTTQLMFDEALNARVLATQPYAQRTGRDTFNDGDSIYQPSMLLKVTQARDGYVGCIVLNADPDHDGV
ncbi:protocatechuate dioxygenase [Amycolatopsis sp. OK19-0408]|uniref:Protocatechuate dioxygenase n=1 Tax=Amycolatopsis iheyensis TaxID=2945988 RepID=A0A9X2SPW0_9PSEU|nr:protocatechuate dioxygenase [Amycolatopsis iheyensis]MCR6489113.1 protocatechuate dioxygenase [Amycolatopsis iheyensis]